MSSLWPAWENAKKTIWFQGFFTPRSQILGGKFKIPGLSPGGRSTPRFGPSFFMSSSSFFLSSSKIADFGSSFFMSGSVVFILDLLLYMHVYGLFCVHGDLVFGFGVWMGI